jgi:hypothetical protein
MKRTAMRTIRDGRHRFDERLDKVLLLFRRLEE